MKTQNIDILLRALVIRKASDLHLQAGSPPVFRVHGDLCFSDLEPLSNEDIENYIYAVMNESQKQKLEKGQHIDLSYAVAGVARFRVNVFRQRGSLGAAMRVIPLNIPSMESLGLPPVMKSLALKPNGLILLTGPTGVGKSTTLAALIDYINSTRKGHIITIEDPLEFLHSNRSCMVNQREVGVDVEGFSSALRDALREDPDVILVGEMRDLETISNAITAAETGHLVFATLHTNSAAQTIDRIVDVFPAHQQNQIRTQLAATLRAVIAQVLLRRKDGSGRVAAFEIMLNNMAVRNLIKEGKSNQIENAIQTGKQDSMQTMADSIKVLLKQGLISLEEAMLNIADPKLLS